MEDLSGILIKRIRDKDPLLTPQELEKEIANCIGTKINEIIKQTVTDGYIALLQQTIKDAFGFSCEIAPALSLYVNVTSESNENEKISIDSFSSLLFEKALTEILEKDFCTLSDEQVIESTERAINQGCKQFLDSVLLPHPLLMKIFERFTKIFHDQLAIVLRNPARIIINMGPPPKNTTTPVGRPGMYL